MRLVALATLCLTPFATAAVAASPQNQPILPGRTFEAAILPPKSTRAYSEATPITRKDAELLFEYFHARKDIPFAYPEDGCYARAHLIAKVLEANGIISLKLFATADRNDRRFYFSNPYSNDKSRIDWHYHVAPAVLVYDERQEKARTYTIEVIDPSLFESPVPASEWIAAMAKHMVTDGTFHWRIEPRFFYSSTQRGLKDWQIADLVDMEDQLEKFRDRSLGRKKAPIR